MIYILLLLGFVLLIKGADFFVDGSSSLAAIMKVPAVIIGLTIVALGTSAPEASVSISAALSGNNDIALSNVIGSNMFNTLVVVGVSGIIAKFHVHKDIISRDMPINILASVALLIFAFSHTISRIEGALLTLGIIAYMMYMVYRAKNGSNEGETIKQFSLPMSLAYIVIGIIGVIWGGDLVVDNAVLIAKSWGVSQNFIALTIIAIGTSLPELVTSVVASRKGHSDLALGNAIGSNLFNILFIIGVSSFIHPLHVINETIVDCIILVVVSILMFIFARTQKEIDKKEGVILVACYIAFTIFLFIR